MDVWIARDADGGLFMFNHQPEWSAVVGEWNPGDEIGSGYSPWPDDAMFPEVGNGECRAARVGLIAVAGTGTWKRKEALF